METNPADSPAGAAIGAGIAILGALALVSLRDVVDNANLALALVLLIVVCGYFGGRWTGAGAAVGAALSFDFFLTQPYLHLRIDSSDDVVTTLLLLAIGLVVGQLAVLARRRERTAIDRHADVERVWRVAELAATGADPDDITSAVRAELLSLLRLSDCTYNTGPLPGVPVMRPQGTVPDTDLRYQDNGFELPRQGVALSVHIGNRVFGHLVCRPLPDVGISSDQRHVAVVLADQLALALAARSRPSATSET
jgi:K+-sensing histidine kinase KdpD